MNEIDQLIDRVAQTAIWATTHDDAKSWSNHAKAIATLRRRAEEAERQLAASQERETRPLDVIKMVEYPDNILRFTCPWCGGIDPKKVDWKIRPALDTGHKPDCPRQGALAEPKEPQP